MCALSASRRQSCPLSFSTTQACRVPGKEEQGNCFRALQVPKLPAKLEARLQDDGSLPSYRAPQPNDKIFQCFRQMLASVGAIEFQKRYGSNE